MSIQTIVPNSMKANLKKISKADLELLRKKLLEQQKSLRAQLKLELDNLASYDRPVMSDDISGGAQDSVSQDVQAGLGENAAASLADVHEALQRLDSPEFGVCDICDKPIATTRLKAVPHALTCLKCQTELEKAG